MELEIGKPFQTEKVLDLGLQTDRGGDAVYIKGRTSVGLDDFVCRSVVLGFPFPIAKRSSGKEQESLRYRPRYTSPSHPRLPGPCATGRARRIPGAGEGAWRRAPLHKERSLRASLP